MQYITRRRARFRAICGRVNIPYGTGAQERDGFLYLSDGRQLCTPESKHGEDFFCSDEDGLGQERGAYINAILARLQMQDDQRLARWDKVWASDLCARYRRHDHKDFWLWSHSLYRAPVEDLEQIAALIGAKATRR